MHKYPFILSVENVTIDQQYHQVFVNNIALSLTPKEYHTLELLIQKKGHVVSKNIMIERLYGGASEQDSDVIDIFVRKLRKKLAAAGAVQLIDTSRRQGFKIAG